MLKKILVLTAIIGLAACETMPAAFSQTTSSGTTRSSTGTSAGTTAAASTTSAPAPSYRQPPDQQLLELERRLAAQAQTGGLGQAYASVIDPSEGFIVRAGRTYATAEEIAAGLAPPPGAGPIYWQPDRVEVSNAGDMGVTSGRYVQVITGQEAIQGRYTAVWRRDGAGEWKLLTESRIADPPRTAVRTTTRRR